jgi:hypothetical protein
MAKKETAREGAGRAARRVPRGGGGDGARTSWWARSTRTRSSHGGSSRKRSCGPGRLHPGERPAPAHRGPARGEPARARTGGSWWRGSGAGGRSRAWAGRGPGRGPGGGRSYAPGPGAGGEPPALGAERPGGGGGYQQLVRSSVCPSRRWRRRWAGTVRPWLTRCGSCSYRFGPTPGGGRGPVRRPCPGAAGCPMRPDGGPGPSGGGAGLVGPGDGGAGPEGRRAKKRRKRSGRGIGSGGQGAGAGSWSGPWGRRYGSAAGGWSEGDASRYRSTTRRISSGFSSCWPVVRRWRWCRRRMKEPGVALVHHRAPRRPGDADVRDLVRRAEGLLVAGFVLLVMFVVMASTWWFVATQAARVVGLERRSSGWRLSGRGSRAGPGPVRRRSSSTPGCVTCWAWMAGTPEPRWSFRRCAPASRASPRPPMPRRTGRRPGR